MLHLGEDCSISGAFASANGVRLRLLDDLGFSRFKQLQDSRWFAVCLLRAQGTSRKSNQPCGEVSGCEQDGAFFLVCGGRLHNGLLALVDARALFPGETFALPPRLGGKRYLPSNEVAQPTLLMRQVPHSLSCRARLHVLRAEPNKLRRRIVQKSALHGFSLPLPFGSCTQRAGALEWSTLSRKRVRRAFSHPCELGEEVERVAVRAHIASLGGVDQLLILSGWEGIARVERGAPLLAAGLATDARLLMLLEPDAEEEEEVEK